MGPFKLSSYHYNGAGVLIKVLCDDVCPDGLDLKELWHVCGECEGEHRDHVMSADLLPGVDAGVGVVVLDGVPGNKCKCSRYTMLGWMYFWGAHD